MGSFDHIKQEALLQKLHTYPAIKQEALLQKLHTYPALRKAIKGWLKAGVMEGCTFSPTEVGTPQGGVVSPLLMNVALHGMETTIIAGYSKSHTVEKPRLIRYADDVRHLTQDEILLAEKRGSEEDDLWVTLPT